MGLSLREELAALPQAELDDYFAGLTDTDAQALLASWQFWARPEQLSPSWAWRWWVLITGRGWGKNRTGAEYIVDRCEQFAGWREGWENASSPPPPHPHLVGLIGQNNDDVKALQIRGESGLKEVVRRRGHRWQGADGTLTPKIGVLRPHGDPRDPADWHWSELEVHTAENPEGPRGRNFHTLWVDELAAFKHKTDAVGNTVFTNAEMALRARCPDGMHPQGVVTTTPKPIPIIRDLLAGKHGPTAISRGSMYDNRANLDDEFVNTIEGAYLGTRLAQQEIHGAVVDSVEGAIWDPDIISRWRLRHAGYVPELARIVIAVDPSGSDGGDECGIIVVGLGRDRDQRGLQHLYVLDDLSMQNRPELWATEVVEAYRTFEADMVVAEVNFGAALVADVIGLTAKAAGLVVPFDEVRASRGKRVRAEPVAALYHAGQGRCHHVGVFPQLEEQMTFWTPKDPTSPDRMDALVWACSYLIPDLMLPPAEFAKGWATNAEAYRRAAAA
jgi:phage terminase large subunit-like protein